jgi:hypothetical protein
MAIADIMVIYERDTDGITSRQCLNEMIASKRIIQFYRESEKKWVTVGIDPIRGVGGIYDGPERRSPLMVGVSFGMAI